MAFQLFGQKFMHSRSCSIFCSNLIIRLKWSWKVPKTPAVHTQTHTYSFTLYSTTLSYICSHILLFFNINDRRSNIWKQVFQILHPLDSCNAVAQRTTHTQIHKQSLLHLATFKFGLIPNSWPQNFKTKVVSLDLCVLQLRMKRAGHSSKAINFDAENIINGNV